MNAPNEKRVVLWESHPNWSVGEISRAMEEMIDLGFNPSAKDARRWLDVANSDDLDFVVTPALEDISDEGYGFIIRGAFGLWFGRRWSYVYASNATDLLKHMRDYNTLLIRR